MSARGIQLVSSFRKRPFMMTRSLIAAKVRRAAEDVASGRETHSCSALYRRRCNARLLSRYRDFFCPEGVQNCDVYWLDSAMDSGYIDRRDMLDWRIAALCFLAAMVKSGDLDDVIKE